MSKKWPASEVMMRKVAAPTVTLQKKGNDMLTAKQEAFAQAIADGMTQADAYRTAYSAEKMSDNAIYCEASLLLDNPKVAQRVAEIKQTLAKRQLWTREMGVKALMKAYKVAEQEKQSTAMTAAAKALNEMHGYNAPIKVEHTNVADAESAAELTDDQLVKVINGGYTV